MIQLLARWQVVSLMTLVSFTGCLTVRDKFPEAVAIKNLRAIQSAESLFFRTNSRYARGDELDFASRGLLEGPIDHSQSADKYQYVLELTTTGYDVKAWARSGQWERGLHSFCADQTRSVRRYGSGGPPDCSKSGEIVQ
jgi:hypothetical protein